MLPFENLSTDKQQEFFADGISEDLLDLLTKIPALRVAARTSSFSFEGKDVAIDSIARALRVANVLQGSVQRAGDQVRVSVQLVHAADGYQVWSQTWDRKLDDVFKIQDEIARDVADKLRVKLLGEAPKARQTDPKAYALYLQARELARQQTPESLTRSDSLLWSLERAQEAVPLIEYAVARWRTLQNLSPGAAVHNNIATALLLKGDAPAALTEIQQSSSKVWRMIDLPMIYLALGREAESDSALAALIRTYPKDAPYNIAYIYALRGQADSAFAWLGRAVEYADPGLADIAVDPFFDKVHSDPRWLPFLRKIGKAPEQLEKIEFHVELPASDTTDSRTPAAAAS